MSGLQNEHMVIFFDGIVELAMFGKNWKEIS